MGPIGLRRSINGLLLLVSEVLEPDPFCETRVVLCNPRLDKLKVLHCQGAGFWLHYRRLERGRFSWPQVSEQAVSLEITTGNSAEHSGATSEKHLPQNDLPNEAEALADEAELRGMMLSSRLAPTFSDVFQGFQRQQSVTPEVGSGRHAISWVGLAMGDLASSQALVA